MRAARSAAAVAVALAKLHSARAASVEAGTLTTVTAEASLYDSRPSASGGCDPAGCVAGLTRVRVGGPPWSQLYVQVLRLSLLPGVLLWVGHYISLTYTSRPPLPHPHTHRTAMQQPGTRAGLVRPITTLHAPSPTPFRIHSTSSDSELVRRTGKETYRSEIAYTALLA